MHFGSLGVLIMSTSSYRYRHDEDKIIGTLRGVRVSVHFVIRSLL